MEAAEKTMDLLKWLVPLVILAIVVLPSAVRILREYERAVVFRLGKLLRAKGPALVLLIPMVDRMVRMDLRVVTIDVPKQEIMTRDNVSVTVDAVVYFRVVDPVAAVIRVENFLKATSLIAQTTLRSVVCAMSNVAFRKFSTLMTAATGSTTRKYTTASTVTETLSRVMISCLGTSIVTTRRSIRTMRSTMGISSTRAGPLALRSFPSRNTTARSYSRRIRTAEGSTTIARITRGTSHLSRSIVFSAASIIAS